MHSQQKVEKEKKKKYSGSLQLALKNLTPSSLTIGQLRGEPTCSDRRQFNSQPPHRDIQAKQERVHNGKREANSAKWVREVGGGSEGEREKKASQKLKRKRRPYARCDTSPFPSAPLPTSRANVLGRQDPSSSSIHVQVLRSRWRRGHTHACTHAHTHAVGGEGGDVGPPGWKRGMGSRWDALLPLLQFHFLEIKTKASGL